MSKIWQHEDRHLENEKLQEIQYPQLSSATNEKILDQHPSLNSIVIKVAA